MPRKHPLPFSVLCWISVTSWGFSKKLQEMLGDDWLSLGWPEGIQTTPFIPMYLRTISITLKITYNLSKFVYFMTCPLGFTKKIEMMFLWRSMCFWRCQFGPGSGGSAPQCHPNCKAHPGCCLGTTQEESKPGDWLTACHLLVFLKVLPINQKSEWNLVHLFFRFVGSGRKFPQKMTRVSSNSWIMSNILVMAFYGMSVYLGKVLLAREE